MVCVVECASFTIRVKNQLPTLVKCLISNDFFLLDVYLSDVHKQHSNQQGDVFL